MEYRVYGYARVSSKEQNTDRQIQALLDFGVDEHNIIVDKKSGKDMKREGIDSAKQRGVKFGRPRAKKPDNWESVMEKVNRGIIRPIDAMREMGLKKRYCAMCSVVKSYCTNKRT